MSEQEKKRQRIYDSLDAKTMQKFPYQSNTIFFLQKKSF